MRVYDLTQRIGRGIVTVYPGDPEPTIEAVASYEADGYYANTFCMHEHTGTHVDAPAHMIPGGKTIDRIPPDRLVGPAILVDARGHTSIDEALLHGQLGGEARDKFVLVHTGWRPPEEYPVLTRRAAELLARLGVKGLGLDTPSPDREPYEAHRILLSRGVPIIENLAGLGKLLDIGARLIPTLVVAPLPIAGGSGAPARVLAILP
ncbi:MAG: cyclase family protein [Desulfurococcales archaeon]|nr:cyclase family protein [Desulfurococcales archaeon]